MSLGPERSLGISSSRGRLGCRAAGVGSRCGRPAGPRSARSARRPQVERPPSPSPRAALGPRPRAADRHARRRAPCRARRARRDCPCRPSWLSSSMCRSTRGSRRPAVAQRVSAGSESPPSIGAPMPGCWPARCGRASSGRCVPDPVGEAARRGRSARGGRACSALRSSSKRSSSGKHALERVRTLVIRLRRSAYRASRSAEGHAPSLRNASGPQHLGEKRLRHELSVEDQGQPQSQGSYRARVRGGCTSVESPSDWSSLASLPGPGM
jgi:hypothetical protein